MTEAQIVGEAVRLARAVILRKNGASVELGIEELTKQAKALVRTNPEFGEWAKVMLKVRGAILDKLIADAAPQHHEKVT